MAGPRAKEGESRRGEGSDKDLPVCGKWRTGLEANAQDHQGRKEAQLKVGRAARGTSR